MPDLVDIIVYLIVGGVAGWIAGLIMRGSGFGVLGNIIIGIVGAIIGGSIFSFLGIGAGGLLGGLVMAVIGAVILLFIASLFRGGRSTTASRI